MTNKHTTQTKMIACNTRSVMKKCFLLAIFISIIGCATVGKDFSSDRVPEIQVGKTEKIEIRRMFGAPWRVGLEDGQQTWTYGRYQYRIFGKSHTKDLVVRFNEKDVVESYSFNTTDHSE